MYVCPIVVLALFVTAALMLPSTHGTRLSVAEGNIKKKLHEQVAQLSKSISQASHTAGSVYVRWGSASCPQTAQLVYSGSRSFQTSMREPTAADIYPMTFAHWVRAKSTQGTPV